MKLKEFKKLPNGTILIDDMNIITVKRFGKELIINDCFGVSIDYEITGITICNNEDDINDLRIAPEWIANMFTIKK